MIVCVSICRNPQMLELYSFSVFIFMGGCRLGFIMYVKVETSAVYIRAIFLCRMNYVAFSRL